MPRIELESSSDLSQLFKNAIEGAIKHNGKTRHSLTDDEQVPILKDFEKRYNKSHDFKPGDIVCLKTGISHPFTIPKVGQPCVIISVHDEPFYPRIAKNSGTPYWGEPDSIRLAVMHPDGEILPYEFNALRFEPYKKTTK